MADELCAVADELAAEREFSPVVRRPNQQRLVVPSASFADFCFPCDEAGCDGSVSGHYNVTGQTPPFLFVGQKCDRCGVTYSVEMADSGGSSIVEATNAST